MLETENSTLAGRVQDLERKVLEQGDELVCLRATLADVLRRLNLLEGLRQNGPIINTAPSTPVRNGYGVIQRSGVPVQKDLKLRTPTYNNRIELKEAKRVVTYSNNSSLPQVRCDILNEKQVKERSV